MGASTSDLTLIRHGDREQAKRKAEELAFHLGKRRDELPADFRRGVIPLSGIALRSLFDNYLREVTPQKGESKQKHDRRAAELFLTLFGPSKEAASFNRRDWDAFIRWRRSGGSTKAGETEGRPLRTRVVVYDLKFLQSVLNWATVANFGDRPLLDRNPLRGMPWPKEEEPRRPTLTVEQFEAMLQVAQTIDGRFELALVLAHETGHRIGAIRMLRWSDVDLERDWIHWRGENDKIGFDHKTPLTSEAKPALQRARALRPSIGDAWIFTAPGNTEQPCSRHLMRDWWQRAEALAEIEHEPGLGWHSLRRRFANDLKAEPLKDLCHLGGWKDPQTVFKCYQSADENTMRAVLRRRQAKRAHSQGG